jgi:tetratricopeptide (TPR) repeat protein
MRFVIIATLFATTVAVAQTQHDVAHRIASDLRAGRYAQARTLLDAALKQYPRDAQLLTLNGLAFIHAGQRAQALAAFDQALAIAPRYLPALEGAAQIEYEDRSPRAEALLRRIVAIRPDDETSHKLLASLAFRRGDCDSAKAELTKAQPGAGSSADVLREFGSCLVSQKRNLEAVPVFQRVSEMKPQDPDALYDLAAVQFLSRRYRDAIATLTSRPDPNGEALDLLAESYAAGGQIEKAEAPLREAIAKSPDVPRYYADFSYLCLARGEFQKGLDVVNSGLTRLPQAAELYVARGVLYSEFAHYDKAAADFKTAQAIDPQVELGAAAKGLAELQQSELPQAEQTARQRIKQQPSDAFSHYLLAEVLTREGAAPGSTQFEEALKAASTAVTLKPDFALARDLLSRLYLEDGRIDAAIEQSRLAVRENPSDETALYHLILALRRGKQTAEVPDLVSKLVLLRQQTRRRQTIEQKYGGPK